MTRAGLCNITSPFKGCTNKDHFDDFLITKTIRRGRGGKISSQFQDEGSILIKKSPAPYIPNSKRIFMQKWGLEIVMQIDDLMTLAKLPGQFCCPPAAWSTPTTTNM